MEDKPKRKPKPRNASTVRVNLERFPWENPLVRAALCRIVDIAVAKIAKEDKDQGAGTTTEGNG